MKNLGKKKRQLLKNFQGVNKANVLVLDLIFMAWAN